MTSAPRRLTDDQLADARLEIDDPLAFANLTNDRPSADLTPEIVGEYHLPSDHDAIWCCHCQAHRHRNGFVITNSTSFNHLIGSTCGPNHYGLSFSFARTQHRTLTRRKAILERLRNICAVADLTFVAVGNVLASDGLRRIDLKRAEIKKASEQVAMLLATAIQNSSPLQEMIQVRDLEAERRRDENLPEGKSGGPIYTQQPRSLGTVSGAGLLRRRDCRDILLSLREAVRAVRDLGKGATDGCTLHALTKAVKSAEDTWAEANEAISSAKRAPNFFSADNLSRLERWSDIYNTFSLRAEGTSLIVTDKSITTIAPLDVIVLDRIPQMKPEELD
jgi:hypothetical protein